VTDTDVLPNGAIVDAKSRKIVKAAPGAAWDSKKASEMAKRRWAAVQARTRKGIETAVAEKRVNKEITNFPEAHQEVIETLMKDVVLNPEEKGSDRSRVYGSLLGMTEGPVSKKTFEDGSEAGLTISFSQEVAKYLLKGLAQHNRQAPQVVEAEFKVEGDESG